MKPVAVLAVVVASLTTTACAPLLHPGVHGFPTRRAAHPGAVRAEPPVGRWDRVVAVRPGTPLAIMTTSGEQRTGTFIHAGMDWLRISADGAVTELPRDQVMRIDVLAGGRDGARAEDVLAGAAKGAAAFGGAMMLVPYLITGDVWVPPARVWGVGAAFGAAGAVQKGRLAEDSRTIYLAPGLLGKS